MRALIFTFGTRGDVDPYVALASRLQREGHAVTLSAPGVYREDLERRGIRFEPMGDAMHDEMRALMADSRGPVEAATLARHMSQAMRRSLSEQWTVAQKVDPTVIVSHPKALAGVHIAERLGIPFVASLPLPFLTPTRDFAIPFVARRFPGPVNHLSYQFNRFTALAYGGMINRFRTQTLGMRRTSRMSDYLHRDGERVPVLYPFSPHVVPPPADYPDSAHITGYWFPENDSDEWTPPPALREFLEAGPAIYIGFGSMGFGKPSAERSKTVLEDRMHDERLAPAPSLDDLVASLTCDSGDCRRVPDPLAQNLRERREVSAHPLRPRGIPRRGCGPTGRLENATRGRVRELRPRREEAHVTPLGYGGRGTTAPLDDDHVLLAFDEMRRGGEALGAGSDDDDGKLRHHISSD